MEGICTQCGEERRIHGKGMCPRCYNRVGYLARKGACADCGVPITKEAKRCRPCAGVEAVDRPGCVECGVKVSHGAKRCQPCVRARRKTRPESISRYLAPRPPHFLEEVVGPWLEYREHLQAVKDSIERALLQSLESEAG